MPIIKSAIKKLRQDKKRTKHNLFIEEQMKDSVKKAVSSKKGVDITKAISLVNKAAKRSIIHKNKASRITSRLSKLNNTSKIAGSTIKTKTKSTHKKVTTKKS